MEAVICPACGWRDKAHEVVCLRQGDRGVHQWCRCQHCKSYFFLEYYNLTKEVVHAEKMIEGKEDTGIAVNDFKRPMYLSVLRLLAHHCPPPATLLDVGCSFGGFLLEARKLGYVTYGLDILPRAVAYVQAQGIPAEVASSIDEFKSVGASFLDVISCLDCNMYWPHQPSEISHAFNRLKPGGFLVMRVVDKSWMFSFGRILRMLIRAPGERVIHEAVNDHRFSMPVCSLLRVLEEAGFRVIYASPRGALHSNRTKLPVKASFALGYMIWKLSGIFLAPGALVLARKPSI
jgi:SAM-dependent methyltransferase